jgi:hypothetical protein
MSNTKSDILQFDNSEPSTLKSKSSSGSSQVKMRPPSNVSRPTSTIQTSAAGRKPAPSPNRPAVRPNSIPLRPKSESNVKLNGTKPQTPSKIPPSSKSSHSLNQAAANAEKRLHEAEKRLVALQNCVLYNGNGFTAMSTLFMHVNEMVGCQTNIEYLAYLKQF